MDQDRIGSRHPVRLHLKEWVKFRDLDQKRLAERMSCEPGTVSKLMSGKLKLSTEWLARFADALNTSVPDLFRDPRRPSPEDLLRGVTDEKRDEILRVIKAMTEAA